MKESLEGSSRDISKVSDFEANITECHRRKNIELLSSIAARNLSRRALSLLRENGGDALIRAIKRN